MQSIISRTKSRERDFILYIQAMSFLASKDGYSKTSIGKAIYRNHATVINSCRIINNGIETRDKKNLYNTAEFTN